MEIDALIDSILHLSEHYIVRAKTDKHRYYTDFLGVAKTMKNALSAGEYEFWLAEKMLLKNQKFKEKTFIQGAVETTVAAYFAANYPAGFQVEAQINPANAKDVDVRLLDGKFIFNIEVKCSDFEAKEKVDRQEGFKYATVGRLDDRGQEAKSIISAALNEVMGNRGEAIQQHLNARNMDNTMMDFLKLAHEKFYPVASDEELNVLWVGCGNEIDMQYWYNYLTAAQGLFMPDSFEPHSHFNLVDVVVLSNMYDRHYHYFEKAECSSWDLAGSLNLIFYNPHALRHKAEAIEHFIDILPGNHYQKFHQFEIKGDAPFEVKESVAVTHFIKEYLEDHMELHYFPEKIQP